METGQLLRLELDRLRDRLELTRLSDELLGDSGQSTGGLETDGRHLLDNRVDGQTDDRLTGSLVPLGLEDLLRLRKGLLATRRSLQLFEAAANFRLGLACCGTL